MESNSLRSILFGAAASLVAGIGVVEYEFHFINPNKKIITETTTATTSPLQVMSSASFIPGKYPQASERYLTQNELSKCNDWELKIMRNEIYARHGYVFNINKEIIDYFNSQNWYINIRKTSSNQDYIYNNYLSKIEKHNIDIIKICERD